MATPLISFRWILRIMLIAVCITGTVTVRATPAWVAVIPAADPATVGETSAAPRVGQKRPGLFQRGKVAWMVVRQFSRSWLRAAEPGEGDRLAKSSRTLGIIGISCLGGIIIPYIGTVAFLAALVLGIIAIVQGRSARRLGSTQKTGEKLGYVTVGIWLLLLLLAVALVYLLLITWGG